jgi:hypothetical protein
MFKTQDHVWLALGESGEDARRSLLELIDREWPDAPVNEERKRAVRDAYAERVPTAIRLIRTFPLSDIEVY